MRVRFLLAMLLLTGPLWAQSHSPNVSQMVKVDVFGIATSVNPSPVKILLMPMPQLPKGQVWVTEDTSVWVTAKVKRSGAVSQVLVNRAENGTYGTYTQDAVRLWRFEPLPTELDVPIQVFYSGRTLKSQGVVTVRDIFKGLGIKIPVP